MIIDQLGAYTLQREQNRPGGCSRLPDWAYEQKFPYPHHPQFRQLAEQYKKAKGRHDESVETLQFAYTRRWENPGTPQNPGSINECKRQIEQSEKELHKAEQALKEFVSHEPNQRIALYESEIANLEAQLLNAHAKENEYTTRLLDDPDAAKKRLERLVNGFSGSRAEYSDEQLAELRSLKNNIQSLEGQILNCQRDIQFIIKLASEEERKAEIQTAVNLVITEFDQCCDALTQAMKKLEVIALEHKIRLIKGDLRAPASATFNQGSNVIRIEIKN